MGTRIGCVASEKGAAEKEMCDVGGGLGLRMQTTTNDSLFTPPEKMMMYTPHHDHHHDDDNHDHGDDDEPPTLLTATGGGFGEEHGCQGGDSRSGPLLCNNTSNTNHNQLVVTSMGDIYDVVRGGGGGGAAAAADSGSFVMPLPPKSLLFSSSDSLMSHNSSGIVVPFTAAQRQELETQALIYKYMMASVPVPPQLLIPISRTSQNFPHLYSTRPKAGGSLEMGVSSSTDLEPWRCRRTDGKKWRCSRNVVPDQKYCERHSHKSRPRSRKPVEQQQQQQQQQQQHHQQQLYSHFFNYNNRDTNTNSINTGLLAYPKSSSFLDQREKLQSPYSTTTTTTTTTSHDQTRGLEWFMMKGEEANSNQAEWHQVVHVKPPPQQGQGQERAFGFYGQYEELQISQGLSDGFGSLIDPKLGPNQTRHIIDAWSMAERDHIGGEICHHHNNKCYVVSSNDKVPYSSLSLSMQGGNGNGNGDGSEESENSHMGFGIEGDLKRQWLNNNNNNNNNNNIGSWNMGSSSSTSPPPGGPLAEALCLGMAGSTRLTTSPRSSS